MHALRYESRIKLVFLNLHMIDKQNLDIRLKAGCDFLVGVDQNSRGESIRAARREGKQASKVSKPHQTHSLFRILGNY